MKFILLISAFSIISTSSIAATIFQKVPGKDYTYRDRIIQRQILQDMRNRNKPAPLNGLGEEFQGNVEIIENRQTMEKDYMVFVRNCGKVKLNKKSAEEMRQVSQGTRVVLRFGESWKCEVTDWRVF